MHTYVVSLGKSGSEDYIPTGFFPTEAEVTLDTKGIMQVMFYCTIFAPTCLLFYDVNKLKLLIHGRFCAHTVSHHGCTWGLKNASDF